ncbi:alpha-1,6-mannosyltransferase [Amycolatopsis marina]|uniref:Alpha-1,6-mannosyltransferase n=1 Tax=Amycolatopsis marina TaxID=490629 RepID=A0A1I1BMK2_9PSEU|nr:polyprenol phosphomannose-dependent alpha 1,6 mannosyltransferase MptB [Amycolatopsis marina]SFB49978.1 alpha-1,6-mannosyltransferase [Amycolatopsis marina]
MSYELRLAQARSGRAATCLRWTGFAGLLLLVVMVFVAAGTAGRANSGTVFDWLGGLPFVTLTVAVAGMGLFILAWLFLGRLTWPDGRHTVTGRWLRRTLALWSAPLMFVPPLFSGDVHSYLAQGAIAARGGDPYAVGPATGLGVDAELTRNVSSYWVDTPSPYGPLFSAVERTIAQISAENVFTGIALHRVLEVAGLVAIVWAVPRLARRAGVPAAPALWLGVLNPLVLWHLVAGIHNDSLMLGLMLVGVELALAALSGARIAWLPLCSGVGVIALAANVKLVAVIALATVGAELARRWGAGLKHLLVSAAAMTAALALVTIVVSAGAGLGFGWVRTVSTSTQVNSWLAPTNWAGFLVGGIGSWFDVDITQSAISVGRLVGAVLAVVAIAVLIWRQLRGRTGALQTLALVSLAIIVFGPVVQPWYVLWASVPFAVCLGRGRARGMVTGATAVLALALPPMGGDFGGRIGDLVLAYVVASVVVAGAAYVLQRRLFPARTVLATEAEPKSARELTPSV